MSSSSTGELDVTPFAALAGRVLGLNLPDSRRSDLQRAVRRAQAKAGDIDPGALLRRLGAAEPGDPVLDVFVSQLTVNETWFFRFPAQFRALADHVLPQLIARRRAERRLRFWSAGCSSGEEPYSLAIALNQILPVRDQWDVSIRATDIDREALARAERGIYPPRSLREVPPQLRDRYFTLVPEGFQLAAHVRAQVTLAYLNLVADRYPSAATGTTDLDLIVCRNVLIYFDADTLAMVVDRFARALAPGGWLIVAAAELPTTRVENFIPRRFAGTVFLQRPEPAGATRGRPPQEVPAPAPRLPRRARATARRPAVPRPQAADAASTCRMARTCADRGDLDGAERWLAQALAADPLLAEAHYLRGVLLSERGADAEAVDALRRCVYLDPGHGPAHASLAPLLLRQGHRRRAEAIAAEAQRLLGGVPSDQPLAGTDDAPASLLDDLAALGLLPRNRGGRS